MAIEDKTKFAASIHEEGDAILCNVKRLTSEDFDKISGGEYKYDKTTDVFINSKNNSVIGITYKNKNSPVSRELLSILGGNVSGNHSKNNQDNGLPNVLTD